MALSNSSAVRPNSLATASRLALGSSAACLSADLGASALVIFSAKARSAAGLVSAARSPLSTTTTSTKLSDLFSKDGTTARESQGERRTKSLPGGECKTCRVIQSFTCVWGAKRILTVQCRSEVSEPPSPLTPICTPRTGCPCTSSTCTTRKPVSAEAGRHVPKKRRASSARRRGQLIRNFRFSSQQPLTIYPFRDSNAQIFSLAEPRARNRVQTMRMRAPNCWSRPSHLVLSDTPPSPLGSGAISRLPQLRLSRRKRQSGDPPEHTAKQPFRQVAFRQQQPIIPGMFHQPSSGL